MSPYEKMSLLAVLSRTSEVSLALAAVCRCRTAGRTLFVATAAMFNGGDGNGAVAV